MSLLRCFQAYSVALSIKAAIVGFLCSVFSLLRISLIAAPQLSGPCLDGELSKDIWSYAVVSAWVSGGHALP